MTDVQPVTRERHAEYFWKRPVSFFFTRNEQIVPLVASEFAATAAYTTCAFMKTAGDHILVALLGLEKQQNLFVDPKGSWLGRCVPRAFLQYPFSLAGSGGEVQNLMLSVDEASDLVLGDGAGGEGEPFFDADGNPTPKTMERLRELLDYREQMKQTITMCAQLADLGLLKAWQLKVQAESSTTELAGLLRIDEERLRQLTGQEMISLRDSGALALAYTQLFSLQNNPLLAQLVRFRRQNEARQQNLAANVPQDLFSSDSGNINFDKL